MKELRVDGGPTRNDYLMQFQSNIADAGVLVPDSEELSAIGPAYAAGLQLGVWDESIFGKLNRVSYKPDMDAKKREQKYAGWKKGRRAAGSGCKSELRCRAERSAGVPEFCRKAAV